MDDPRRAFDFWLWPWRWGVAFSEASRGGRSSDIPWATPNEIMADLPTARVRRFASSHPTGRPVLVVAPFAVHDAAIADLAPGHSIVQVLAANGLGPIYLTEWKSATAAMSGFSIDSYLADLNVAVDLATGGRRTAPDLVGLCQGGWMSLLYAAALPGKVGRLVVVGSPVDTSRSSQIALGAHLFFPPDVIDEMIAANGGLVRGAQTLAVFRASGNGETDACETLQIEAPCPPELRSAFEDWDERPVDLPGRYFADVLNWLFRKNRLARGDFPAFGNPAQLSRVTVPLFLLAGARDRVAPPAQLRAAIDLVGTARENIEYAEADCGHLSLFMGARTLAREWICIAKWLREPA